MPPTSTESVLEMLTGRDQPILRCAVYTRQSVARSDSAYRAVWTTFPVDKLVAVGR